MNPICGQEKNIDDFKKENQNWFNKDFESDNILGASVDKTYESLLPQLKVKDTIVVAVIDGGVDIKHEELAGKIWINKKEIPNNGIDDDGNGYVDDVNGWNFIGSKSGENIHFENIEATRVMREHQNDSTYLKAKRLYDTELSKSKNDSINIARFEANYQKAILIIKSNTGIVVKQAEDLNKITIYPNQSVKNAKLYLQSKYEKGFSEKDFNDMKEHNKESLKYFLNPNYNPRSLVGDNPGNINDRNYGNNDVTGPRPEHGTSVAGIIAANRNNSIGINGIASSVKIMPLRVVPEGDERDKDIALAIIYAVDNGARIINMSFGKQISPNKSFVDDALKYAEIHNVLVIHASGNDGLNIDKSESYPSGKFLNGYIASNWMNVGASNMHADKYLPAKFSNYGQKSVDIFAPGRGIVSLNPSNLYSMHSGTSVATPVVTGVAALLLSYFPELTPQELISILLEGSYKVQKPKKVIIPNLSDASVTKAKFNTLSKSGGIVNAYNAFIIATQRQLERQKNLAKLLTE
jgi:subtilisin family serine protease